MGAKARRRKTLAHWRKKLKNVCAPYLCFILFVGS